MNNYPLGSFPRFGHQERWAQDRRQRAIFNSIITRRAKKAARLARQGISTLGAVIQTNDWDLERQAQEGRAMLEIIGRWKQFGTANDGKIVSQETGRKIQRIARSFQRMNTSYNPERKYSRWMQLVSKRLRKLEALIESETSNHVGKLDGPLVKLKCNIS